MGRRGSKHSFRCRDRPFNETWDESGPFGDITGGCEVILEVEVCAYFGLSLNASVSGEIGMSIALEFPEGGIVSVTYPVTVTFTAPADNSFDPGDEVDIKTSMVVDSSNAKIVASFPTMDHLGWNGIYEIKASLDGQVCFFACTEPGNILNIDEGADDEIFGFDPGDFGCFVPSIMTNLLFGLKEYPNDRCNNEGYVFAPVLDFVSTLNADGTISADGEDVYAILPVNANPLGTVTIPFGVFDVSHTYINLIITTIETMRQDLTFTPRVDVNLNWGKDLEYKVLNGGDDSPLDDGNGTSATFKVGDTLRLKSNSENSKVIPITPTLSMGSATMANHTRNATTNEARIEALAFSITTYDGVGKVDSVDEFGPVYAESFPLGATQASIFNRTFDIGGFNSPVLEAFNIVPRPIVEVRKNVVPVNAPGLFNLKIDSAVLAANIGDAGSTGRTVVEPGTRVISETAGTGADLNFFDISITCVESDGGAVHTQSAGASPGLGASMDLVLTGGEDLICTIKNRLPAPSECDTMTFDNVILGTSGSDILKGTNQRDIIIGYGGEDIIDSGAGDDCVSGNAGNDSIKLGAGNDVGDGGMGNDQIDAGAGDDIVHGGSGNDRLEAGDGNDFVYGEDGDDVLTGANGNDTLDGGPGSDRTNGSNGIDICIAETKTNCES